MPNRKVLFAVAAVASAIVTYAVLSLPSTGGGSGPAPTAATVGRPDSTGAIGASVPDASQPRGLASSEAAVANRVRADADAALREAIAIVDPGERLRALIRVGEAWAAIDPEAALARAATLPAELEPVLRASVTAAWANIDSLSFLAFAERSLDPGELMGGLRALAASHPARVFEIVMHVPYGPDTAALHEAATRAFAQHDPAAALRRLESVQDGRAFERMATIVAFALASRDPDAALDWLSVQASPSLTVRRAVASGIAISDFPRAYGLSASGALAGAFDNSVPAALVSDRNHAAQVGEFLLAEGSTRSLSMLDSVVTSWVARDPDAVLEWLLEERADPPQALLAFVARAVALQDVNRAVEHLDHLPQAAQSAWAVEVARVHAESDGAAALDWVSRYRGQAFFDDAYAQIVLRLADTEPARTAVLLANASPALQTAVVPRVAEAWAARDPLAAVRWAESLRGSDAEAAAVDGLVSPWIAQDAAAARDWILRLPRGMTRDRALSTLVLERPGARLDPRPLIAEIDNPEILRLALAYAAAQTSTNPAVVKELLEAAVDHPVVGPWAKETLERIERTGN